VFLSVCALFAPAEGFFALLSEDISH